VKLSRSDEAVRRRVAHAAVLDHRDPPFAGCTSASIANALAFGVDVVRQHVDQHRRTGEDRRSVGIRHRRQVHHHRRATP
jgi:hypothetical protein